MKSPPITQVIVVCCHGIWLGGSSGGIDEGEWLIAPFQHGETPTFIEHIQAGLRLLSSSPQALLMFSGGPTRPETKISEAESYIHLAEMHHYWGILKTSDLTRRIILEKRALDSFHNFLFSITKFYEVMGYWPEHVTIISNEFKRSRFLDLHGPVVRWPADRLSFIGIDPEYMAEDFNRAASVRGGEQKNGFQAWQKDPKGLGRELEGKRTRRNPWLMKQTLFEREELKTQSGIQFIIVDNREVLGDGLQPWEL